VVCNLSPNFW